MIYELMSMEHWFKDTGAGKLRYSEKTLSQCHFVHPDLAVRSRMLTARAFEERLLHGASE